MSGPSAFTEDCTLAEILSEAEAPASITCAHDAVASRLGSVVRDVCGSARLGCTVDDAPGFVSDLLRDYAGRTVNLGATWIRFVDEEKGRGLLAVLHGPHPALEAELTLLGHRGMPSWFTPVAGALNGVADGVRFGSFYAQFGTTLQSDNSLGYTNSQVVTIDANKNATLYVPPTFTAVPTSIQVTNGDMGANQAFCGVTRANTSLSGIGINCPAAATGAPIRIDYTLTGPR